MPNRKRILRIDMDHGIDLARQDEVTYAPSLVLLDAEGQVVWMRLKV